MGSHFIAQLPGPINLVFTLSDLAIEGVPYNPFLAHGSRSGVPRVMAIDNNDVRRLTGTMQITGSSKDNAIAQVAAINVLLRTGTTLTLQSRYATNAVTLTVLPSDRGFSPLGDPTWEIDDASAAFCKVPFSLTCEPYTYRPELTLVNAVATTYPNVVDLTVPGDYRAPLQITFAGAGLHALYVGLLPDQSTALAALLKEAEALTWTGGTASSVADGNAHGGSREQNVAGTTTAPVVDTALPAATYKLLSRLSQSGAGASAFTAAGLPVALAAAGYTLEEFGAARLPYRAVRGAGVSSLALGMSVGTANPYWDYVGLLPTSWGWMIWHPSNGATVDTTHIVVDYDGRVYCDSLADGVNGRCGGLLACGAQRLVVFADGAHGAGAGSISLTTTVKVIPRYALWA